MTSCKNDFINGAAIEIYPKGGTFSDARGATNLKMTCTNGKLMEIYNNDKSLVFYFDLSVLTTYYISVCHHNGNDFYWFDIYLIEENGEKLKIVHKTWQFVELRFGWMAPKLR